MICFECTQWIVVYRKWLGVQVPLGEVVYMKKKNYYMTIGYCRDSNRKKRSISKLLYRDSSRPITYEKWYALCSYWRNNNM